MNQRTFFLPLMALICFVGYLGFQLGRAAPPSEGDVIAKWAAEYVAWAGGQAKPTDCYATPGGGDVWMVITCVPMHPQQTIQYAVKRDGSLARPAKTHAGQSA